MSDDDENKNSPIKLYEKEDFDSIIQLLELDGDFNPYNFYKTDFFIRSRYSKCFVYEDENKEIIGTIFGILKSKERGDEKKTVLKFHILMIYVKSTIDDPTEIYENLINTMLESISKIKIDNHQVSEINATIPHDKKYDKYLLENLKKLGFFKYELILRFYENGMSALRMKKIIIYPDELEIAS